MRNKAFSRFAVTAGLCFLLVPGQALAATGGSEAGFDWLLWTAKILNFLLFAGVIFYFAAPLVKEMLEKRQESIGEDLAQAEKAVEEVARKKAEAEAELKRLETEAAQIRVRAQQEAEGEKERILEDAARGAERLVEMAEAQIQSAAREARSDLRRYATALAGELAEEKIQKEINDKDRESLFEDAIRSLEAGA